MNTSTEISLHELMYWMAEQNWSTFAQSVAAQYAEKGRVSDKQEAAARSMYAKSQARSAARTSTDPAPAAELEIGLHVNSLGSIIRVMSTRNSRQLVAKGLVRDGYGDWQWEYLGKRGLVGLSADTAMTAAQATAWGQQYHQCVNCFAELEDKRSMAAGYGPTCAKNHGWVYPTMAEAEVILAAREAAGEVTL